MCNCWNGKLDELTVECEISLFLSSCLKAPVFDPDGGIHYQRPRTEKEDRNTSGKQQPVNCCVEWPKEGRSLSLANLPEFSALFHILLSIWRIEGRAKMARSF